MLIRYLFSSRDYLFLMNFMHTQTSISWFSYTESNPSQVTRDTSWPEQTVAGKILPRMCLVAQTA